MDHKIIKKLLDKIKRNKPKILVLGDVMLDQYINGKVNRISPEAPVPILDFKNEKSVLGGAGNVIHNLTCLDLEPSLATILGDDSGGELIINLLLKLKVSPNLISILKSIKTTKKTRFITQGTHLLRLDSDSNKLLVSDLEDFKKRILQKVSRYDCIIISDYNKGVCDELVIQEIIKKANKKHLPIYIDPKGSNWNKYKNATCLTPNTKEIEKQLSLKLESDLDFENAARKIQKRLKLKSCLITRGEDGMTYYDEEKTLHQKVGKKEVFDVSGAGDTVIACLASSVSSGITIEDSIEISSILSSEVVTRIGTVPLSIKTFMPND
ncbi:PfkB family carbohydrate kinase [Candidatus Marinimicrobia bacterium]|nr:PfkB family carbohydrate kinase [Candidatus Neomarinimicrobiota bacterium]